MRFDRFPPGEVDMARWHFIYCADCCCCIRHMAFLTSILLNSGILKEITQPFFIAFIIGRIIVIEAGVTCFEVFFYCTISERGTYHVYSANN